MQRNILLKNLININNVQIRTIMKIEIEKTNEGPFIVKSDGKTSESLGWEEMLGLIAALTIPENKPCVHWMHEEIRDVPFEEVNFYLCY